MAAAQERTPLPASVLVTVLLIGAVFGSALGPSFGTFSDFAKAIEMRSTPLAVGLAVGAAVLVWGGELSGRAGGWVRVLARLGVLGTSVAAAFLLGTFAYLGDEKDGVADEPFWRWLLVCLIVAVLAVPVLVGVRRAGRKVIVVKAQPTAAEFGAELPPVAGLGGEDADPEAPVVAESPEGAGDDRDPESANVAPTWLPWAAVGASAAAVLLSLDASRRARR